MFFIGDKLEQFDDDNGNDNEKNFQTILIHNCFLISFCIYFKRKSSSYN